MGLDALLCMGMISSGNGKSPYSLETNVALKALANFQLSRRRNRINIALQFLIAILAVPVAIKYCIDLVKQICMLFK